MKGKLVIFIIIVFTLIGLALAWVLLKDTIKKYDLEERSAPTETIHYTVNNFYI